MNDLVEVRARREGAVCPYCREPVSEPSWTCPDCHAAQHTECRAEAGERCAACRRTTSRRRASPAVTVAPRPAAPLSPSRHAALTLLLQAGALACVAAATRLLGATALVGALAAALGVSLLATLRRIGHDGPTPSFLLGLGNGLALGVALIALGLDGPEPWIAASLAGVSAAVGVTLLRVR